jgi:hypothetical protein
LLLLPNFVSWIDGGGAFPEWRISFRHFSRLLFASALAGLFTLLFFGVFLTGSGLVSMIGGVFRGILRGLGRNFVILAYASWGAAFCWAARAGRLLDVLERYVLALFSYLMPLLSVFILIFIAALPMGIGELWRRGFSSGVILGVLSAAGLCVLAGWQGGVGDDGLPREPFARPVNILVKISLVLLPVFCPLLVYTIGLRVGQYGWTVDRAISMILAVSFGIWSLAWAFFLIKRRKTWPIFYGGVNRIAFPAVGVALALISSPVCDARRIVAGERIGWLAKSVRAGRDIGDFDWRYIARGLGIYGVRAIEELKTDGGAKFYERFGPFEDGPQAEKIRGELAAAAEALASAEKEKEWRDMRTDAPDARERKVTSEDVILKARTAPVFGGELSPGERERLARRLPEKLVSSIARSARRDDAIGFFYLADMNGDGGKEVLMGLGDGIYLLLGDKALKLGSGFARYAGGNYGADNKTVISDDKQRIIRNQWGMLRINEKVFFVEPDDADELEPAPAD